MPDPARASGAPALLLTLATVASGAAGLVQELVWTRQAATAFGVSAYATSTVLAAFFGGLALGSAAAARWLEGRSPGEALRACAKVEVGIAGSALLVTVLMGASRPLMVALAGALPGHGPLALGARFLAAAAVMLVPTVLMGATFPLLAHGLAGLHPEPRRAVARAYGANVLGGAAGCALTAWVLLPGVGMVGASGLAALVDLGVAAVLWRLAARAGAPVPAGETAEPVLPFAPVAALVALSGGAAMAAEVVWSRVFRFVLGEANPYRAFALTLTLVLAGMGLGALGLSVLGRGRARWRLAAFGGSQLVLGLLAVGGLGAVQQGLAGALGGGPLVSRGVGIATLALCALVLGLGFPLLSSVQDHARTGARVGRLYAVSTLAGVGGSLLGGFVLLPILGSRGALLVVGAASALAGAAALVMVHRRAGLLALVPGAALLWGAVLAPDLPPFSHQGRLLWVRDGIEATSAVVAVDPAGRHRMLVSNGIPIDGLTSAGRATVPLSLVENPRRVLLIGFGTGLTAASLLRLWPELQLDCVELDDNQAEAARFFGTSWLLEDPRFSLQLEDGRQFLLRGDADYDVIIVDSWGQAVNQEFYNADFFRDAEGALSERGLFYVKLPLGSLASTAALDTMVRSAAAGFSHAALLPPGPGGVFPGLLGSRRAIEPAPVSAREQDLPRSVVASYRTAVELLRPVDEALLSRLRGGRVNSDDRPWFFGWPRGGPGAVDAYLFELLDMEGP